jgi:hypothetical protein
MNELNDEETEKLRQMLESWDNIQAGVKALSVIGEVIKWVAGIAVAIASIISISHFKQ